MILGAQCAFKWTCLQGQGCFHRDGANLQTHFLSKIMHQNLAVI